MTKEKRQELPASTIEVTVCQVNDALKKHMGNILGNIRRIMGEKNVNQKELSYRIGSEEPHVSKMLKKDFYKNGLTIKVLTRIALGLEVNISDLIK